MTFQYFERARAAQQAVNDLGAGPPDPCAELREALKDLGAWARREIEQLTLADRQWADHVRRLSEENERLRADLRQLTDHHEQLLQKIEDWNATIAQGAGVARRMNAVIDAAENLIEHQGEGYATTVSYTIRLEQALEVYQASSQRLPEQLEP